MTIVIQQIKQKVLKLTCLTCALSVGLSQSKYMCNASLILRANREDA